MTPHQSALPEPEEPYDWWGLGWDVPTPLSIIDLLAAGNFDTETAALLWLAMRAHTTMIIAADPAGAGKTTTLTALSDFLTPTTQRIFLRGWHETFAFTTSVDPASSYILCNEISNHLPIYLWGRNVHHLFAALGQGFGCGATMHADSPEEVLHLLASYPLALPIVALAHLELILNLSVDYTARRPRRRLDRLTLVQAVPDRNEIELHTLAYWDMAQDKVVHLTPPFIPPFLLRTGLAPTAIAEEQSKRAAYLAQLLAAGIRDRASVRQYLAAYPD